MTVQAPPGLSKEQLAQLISSSSLAWVSLNNMVTDAQRPLEFISHRYMIDFYADEHDDICSIKSAQVGFSVAAIMKAGHACAYRRENVIYVLPTQNVRSDFVTPKVDPLIQSNPAFARLVTKDRESLKQIGQRFLYFKGASSDREAIAISGDLLILDEYDRMPDMGVVNTYDSRLQASHNPRRWRFSNPSGIGYGVDGLWQDSDQRHWFIKCFNCGWRMYIDYESSENKNHYLHVPNRGEPRFACGNCDRTITDQMRQAGEWVQKFPNRHRHGYWINQLMVPYITARRIQEQKNESTTEFFYNFVLGKAYTPSDLVINRETILRACAPSIIDPRGVSIGVDQKASELEWVAMTEQGIFRHGKAKSWEEVEHLKLMWQAVVVCDPNPYPTMPKKMAEKYRDWYLCYFRESKNLSFVEWKKQVVYADRTRLLDTVANEITEAKIMFRERPNELEDYIADWNNIYRTTVEETDGRSKSTWLKKENKESDFPFATAYARIGLSRILTSGGGSLVDAEGSSNTTISTTMTSNGRIQSHLGSAVEDTLAGLED